MATKRDYYEILGVQKGASIDEIKKAYRQLAMQFHPDRVTPEKKKEAEERFKEISEAYAVLSDQAKRGLYDQYGHAGVDSRYSTEDIFREGNFSDVFRNMRGGSGFENIFEDIFSDLGFDMFGGGRTRAGGRAKHRGEDLELELAISLQEAMAGVEREVSFNHYEDCTQCSGTGAQPGSSKETCPTCRGRGVVTSGSGFISFSQACPTCRGEGVRIKHRCSKCGGEGRLRAKKNLKVTVPAGVDTGAVLRLRGEGNWGEGGNGDLYIHLLVRPHENFEREGDDLKSKVKIGLVKAIVGGDMEVATLNGKVKMNVPAGTQPNTIFRLKGKGLPNIRTHHTGDQLVEVEIEIPKKLSSRERDLMVEFAKSRGETI